MNKKKKVLWTSPRPQTITKFSINLPHHLTHLKTWASRGNLNAVFKNCWRASQEGGRLGGLPNLNFLLPLLNLLLVLLSHLLPPGLNNLTLRGEGSPREKM